MMKSINSNKKKKTALPSNLVQELKSLGASVIEMHEEKLFRIAMIHGDASYVALEKWISTLDSGDPVVMAIFNPSPNITGTALSPNLALVAQIQNEANSLIVHYAAFRINDFADGAVPIVGGVIAGVAFGTPILHASITLSKIFSAIQNPPNLHYPVISGLNSGSYICNIIQQWSNAFVTVSVFKP